MMKKLLLVFSLIAFSFSFSCSEKKASVQQPVSESNKSDNPKEVTSITPVQEDSTFKEQPSEIVEAPKQKEIIVISTKFGDIEMELYDETPKHKANFLKLAKEGFYDGTTFHRVIDGFMIQGGDPNSKDSDPNNDGAGGPGYTIEAEFKPHLKHVQGAVAAARQGDAVNPQKRSSGSQFYIVENADGTHFLDGQYTVFGQIIKGMDVVETIAIQNKNRMDRPLEDIKMTVKVKTVK